MIRMRTIFEVVYTLKCDEPGCAAELELRGVDGIQVSRELHAAAARDGWNVAPFGKRDRGDFCPAHARFAP